jgi:two-component system response regulator DesR
MPRVVIVEDHAATRARLAQIVADHPALELAVAVASLAEGRAALAAGRGVDVALIDLDLPDGNGIAIASHVKHIYGKLAVGSRGEAIFEAVQLGILKLQ